MPYWLLILFVVILSIILLLVSVSMMASNLFERHAKKEVNRLFNDTADKTEMRIKKEDLTGLPYPVRKWLENSQVIGKEIITSARLKQKGLMRTKKDGPWIPAQSQQYFRVDEPGFVWKAKVKMAPFLELSGLDIYREGKGKMSIKMLSLFPIVDATGPEMDHGTMLRFLAEMQWFPTAALNPYIQWEPIDDNTAKATMSYKGVTAFGVFTFNDEGELVRFMTKRYREVGGKFVLTDWGGINKQFKTFNGIRIPSKSDIIWVEPTGEFNWFQCEITDLEYNKPYIFE